MAHHRETTKMLNFKMMKTITILLIEDNPSDVRIVKEMLKEINYFKVNFISVSSLKEGCDAFKKDKFDIILLDLNLPDSTGMQTFQKVIDCGIEIPVVLITGTEDEELTLNLIKEGAQDYLTKQNLNSYILGKSILYSIERKHNEKKLRESEEKYRAIFENVQDVFYQTDLA